MQAHSGSGRSKLALEDAARFQDAADRLMQATARAGDSVDELGQQLAVITAETFHGMCSIALLNQHNEMMHIAGLYDPDPRALELIQKMVDATTDLPRDEGVAAVAIRGGKPILVETIPQEQLESIQQPAMVEYMREIGVESLMAVPLQGKSGMIGAVSVTRHRGDGAFSRKDLDFLTSLALRISVALENLLLIHSLRAQLLESEAERATRAGQMAEGAEKAGQAAREWAIFGRLIQAATEHGDNSDRLAHEFAVITAETIGDLVSIVLANPHNDMLHIAATYDSDPHARAVLDSMVRRDSFLPREHSIVGPVVRGAGPLLRKFIPEEEVRSSIVPEFLPFVEQVGMESVRVVPLAGLTGNIGAVILYRHRNGKPYDESDLALVSDMAIRMSLAMENILLIESLREQDAAAASGKPKTGPLQADRPSYLDFTDTNRLAVLHRLTHMIGENRERLDRMMELASVMISESLGGVSNIALLNRHNELVHVAAYYDTHPRARQLMGEVLRATEDTPRDSGMIGSVIQSGQPMLISVFDDQQLKAAGVPAVNRLVDEIGVSSWLAVPIRADSETVGAISIGRHRGDRPFTVADRHFLQEIAYRLAIGIENHQLIESLRQEVATRSSTEVALNASEQRFRSVFDSTALGIEIMDANGVIVDINNAFERMSGFSRGDMLGRPYGTLQHSQDALPFMQMLTEVKMNRQIPVPVENRILRKDGSVLWVRTHLAPIKQPDNGAISLIVALHEDITGRKQTERYFQAVLEATPDALIMVNADGKIVLINRQTESLFGYARHEILGQPVEMLIPERLRDRHPLHRAGYLQDSHIRPMGVGLELFGLRKDRSEFPIEISLSPLEAEGAQVVVAAIRDITERKKREADLVRSERSLAEAQRVARLGSLEYDLRGEA
ncbi:MAG: PAS domain S-box protein, partial [Anaerolineae bacterium]